MIQKCILKYKEISPDKLTPATAKEFVKYITGYFRAKYEKDIAGGKTRKGNHLASAQSTLSKFKRFLIQNNPPSESLTLFTKELHLTSKETSELEEHKASTLHKKAINIPEIDADDIIQDCIKLLGNSNPYVCLMSLACLTGRRMAEILFSMQFRPPTQQHATNSKYWTEISGIGKQRAGENRIREIPLFAPRDVITDAIEKLRAELPASTVEEVNARYGKPTQRIMQKLCPAIHNLHNFRKMYVLVCQHYFNENGCSLARLAADYLGHKTTAAVVLTYLSFRVKPLGKLNFKL